jgi:hypothetical protein
VGDAADAVEVRARVRVLEARLPPPAAALSVTLRPTPPPPPSRARWAAPGAVLGGATVLAVVGAGLLGSVKVDFDRLASGPSSCRPCSEDQISSLRTRADAGYALLAIAGAAAIVDIVLWVRAARRHPNFASIPSR